MVDGGGDFEIDSLALALYDDGRVTQFEIFEGTDTQVAFARFEAIGTEAEPERLLSRGRPMAPRELMDRYVASTNVQDWDALRELYAPDMRFVDHRLVGWGELEGRDAYLEIGRGMAALTLEMNTSAETLAAGRSAIVTRFVYTGRLVEGGGDFEIAGVALALVENEQCTHFEIFEATDASAALERFEEIGAETEPERLLARVCRLATARDWEALFEVWAPDYEGIDHRSLGWDVLHGPEAGVELSRSTVALVPDAEFHFEVLAGDDDRVVAHLRVVGHAADSAGGGPLQYDVALISASSDGRVARNDWFETDSAALAHYEQLRRGRPSSPRELIDPYIAATNVQDWDTLTGLYAPNLRFIDHRLVGWGELEGVDAFVDIGRGTAALTYDLRATYELIAGGAAAYVARFVYRGRMVDGGGDFEIAVLALALHEDWKITHFEIFEPADMGAALEHFEEIGAATEPERRIARICRLANARDWEAFAELWAPDYEGVDHRSPAVWGVLRGPAAPVELWRSWTGIAPDAEFRFETLASDDERIAVRVEGSGHAAESAGGGPLEYEISLVATISGGRTVRNDWFDSDADALAYFEQRRGTSPPATAADFLDRYVAAIGASDFDILGGLFAPDLRFVDHRLIGWGELAGREAYLEILRGASALAENVWATWEPLVVGPAAWVARVTHGGDLVEGGGAFEIATLTLCVAADGLVTSFEMFETADVQAAFERFEDIGAQTEPERLMARLCRLIVARDWDAIAASCTDDFVGTDHRSLGWEPLRGGEGMAGFYRSWAELVPDVEPSFEWLAGDERHGVVVHTGRGHATEGGGQMEYPSLAVISFHDGLIAAMDIYAVDDVAAAMAHYEQLRNGRSS